MNNNFENKVKKLADINTRLDQQSKAIMNIEQIIPAVDRALRSTNEQLSQMAEIVDSLVQLVGVDAVSNAVGENRKKKVLQNEATRKTAVAQGLETGVLEVVDTIADDPATFIAFEELDDKDVRIEGSYYCLQLKGGPLAVYADELVGKQVGYKFKAKKLENHTDDTKLNTGVILGIFKRLPPKTESSKSEDQQAAQSS